MNKIYKILKIGFAAMSAVLQLLNYSLAIGLLVVSPAFQEIIFFAELVCALTECAYSIIDVIFE